MRCERCQRPINAAAVSIHKGKTVYAYGPKCARKAGLIEPRSHAFKGTVVRTGWLDPRQLALGLEVAG